MFGFNETTTIWSGIGLAPIFVWELSLGLWMTLKGFRRSVPLMIEAAAETALLAESAATPPSTVGVAPQAGAA